MSLELWGGHECTVNRLGDAFRDQTVLTGHHDRIEDLSAFAELGFKALRYPVLWERIAPEQPGLCDWRWSDERLGELRRLGVRPIAGLLHHGSGPAYTSLVDPDFPELFEAHARGVAERYDWIEDWTPVNEPLTTARFSALYGHWYPHLTDERAFWTALLNQIDATRLAMRAIRQVNPKARLVQTEDLGQTYSTAPLAEQAAFENHRRWLSWDLLCGKVTPEHPFWPRLARFGLTGRLKRIAEDPCPPDVIGVNHYLTSERFLDHRLELYPEQRHGGNAFTRYADVEAIRVMSPAPLGLEGLLEQAWDRYGLPLAVTESHNGCTREEQMRWTWEGWRAALALRERGVEVEAVTAWALLGCYDWNSLLTRADNHYEPGSFDLRGGQARPTAVTGMLRALATDPAQQSLDTAAPHPVLNGPGWWRRDIRLEFQPVRRVAQALPPRRRWLPEDRRARPLLITGATGTLGQALARACELRGLHYVLTSRADLDLCDEAALQRALDRHQPWAVINAAGYVRVDDAETDEAACLAANGEGAGRLAGVCAERDIHLTIVSSDLVFDGAKAEPYVESDQPGPLNAYGRSKLAAEQAVLASGARALVVRTAAFFSADDSYNFAAWVTRELRSGRRVRAAEDCVVTPTYVPHLVNAVLDLVIDDETGLWHLTNHTAVSWAQFARMIAESLGLDASLIRPTPSCKLGWAAARPAYAALTSERGRIMPDLASALNSYRLAMAHEGEGGDPAVCASGMAADARVA
jgi:dTDP-4-dehydrorhamnose reductase